MPETVLGTLNLTTALWGRHQHCAPSQMGGVRLRQAIELAYVVGLWFQPGGLAPEVTRLTAFPVTPGINFWGLTRHSDAATSN